MKPKDLVAGRIYWYVSSYTQCYCRYISSQYGNEHQFHFYDDNQDAVLFSRELNRLSIPNTYNLNKFLAKEL